LLFASWFGLVTGLAEALFLVVFRQHLRHTIINQSQDILWMAPLAELLIFSLAGSLIALGVWLRPRLISVHLVGFILAFLSFIALLFLFPRLHQWAALLLAAGAAVQTSRFIAAHPRGFASFIRRTGVLLIVLVIGLGLGLRGWERLSEHRALAKLPAARANAPNVLLIVMDTVRASSLSLYGYNRQTTPQLEKIAQRAVVFDHAIATAPWTLPSHASIFTGHLPSEMKFSPKDPLQTNYPTLAEVLSEHGYASAGFVANLIYCNHEQGLNRGMLHYSDYPMTPGQILISSSLGSFISKIGWLRRATGYYDELNRKNAQTINEEFLAWEAQNRGRPFFAFLNYFDAHMPYNAPPPFDTQFGPNKPRAFSLDPNGVGGDHNVWRWPDPVKEVERAHYDGAIAYLDQQLGSLLSELEKRGDLDNTLVIITSDHGEQFGEHGIYDHANSVYLPLIHVPLLMVLPSRVPAGMRVPDAVSLRDLPATVLKVIGTEASRFPGESLSRYWTEPRQLNQFQQEPLFSQLNTREKSLPSWYPMAKGKADLESLILGDYHYIRNGDGSEELYDWKKDEEEKRNLNQSEEASAQLQRARAALSTEFARK
jgi:arylsulfatase A-like enzyme